MDGAPGTPSPGLLRARVQLTVAPAGGPRLDGVVQHGLQSHACGTPPVQWAAGGPAMRTNRQPDLLGHQIPQPSLPTALLLDDSNDEPNEALRLLIRIPLIVPSGAAHVAQGRMIQELTASRLVPHAFKHPACEDVAFRFAHHPPQPQPQAIIVVGRLIETIRLGQQGPQEGPEFESWGPVVVGASHATHLTSQHQPHMVQTDLGQHALNASARHHTLAALALIFINDDHALTRPSPGDCTGHSGIWPCRGLDMLDDVVRMGLAHLHERQASHVMGVELGRQPSGPHRLPRVLSHRAPPAWQAGRAEP